jgi:hypothetical protein
MWRRAGPWLTGVLAVALIINAWRLRDAQTELDRIERLLAVGAPPSRGEPRPATERAVPAGLVRSPDIAREQLDMSSEWEQAVPPMDS